MKKEELSKITKPLLNRFIKFSCELTDSNVNRVKIIEKSWVNFLIEEKELIFSIESKKELVQYRSEAFRILLRNIFEAAIQNTHKSKEEFYNVELISRAVIFLKDEMNLNYEDLEFIVSLDSKKIMEFYFNGKRSLSKLKDAESRGEKITSEPLDLNNSLRDLANEILKEEKQTLLQRVVKALDKTVFEF